MKNLFFACSVLICSQIFAQEDPKARQALNRLKSIVDSVYSINEKWRQVPDTEYVLVPTDPNDPSKTSKEQVVISPESKAESTYLSNRDKKGKPYAYAVMDRYNLAIKNLEPYKETMDSTMKKELVLIKRKYNSVLPDYIGEAPVKKSEE